MTDKYIIFGAGNYGHRILNLIEKKTVDYFIDNDPLKDGIEIDGIKVNYFYNVRHFIQDHTIIVAVSGDKEDEKRRYIRSGRNDPLHPDRHHHKFQYRFKGIRFPTEKRG